MAANLFRRHATGRLTGYSLTKKSSYDAGALVVDDFFEVAATVNATATPAGVTATGSVTNPTASGGATVNGTATPAGVSATGSATNPSASGAAKSTPSGVGATGAVSAPAATGAASAAPAGVTATGSVTNPTASGASVVNGTATPSGVSSAGSVGTATASGTATAQPSGVSATGSVTDPSATGVSVVDGAATVTGVTSTGGVTNPSATGAANASALGVSSTGSVGTPSAYAGSDSYTVSAARANLIYEIALLHGLVPGNPLQVSATSRSAGAVVQTVSGTDTVTITTVSSDVLHGSLDTWIDALAALHGLTTPLVVTSASRTAGALTQSISTTADTTTVQTA